MTATHPMTQASEAAERPWIAPSKYNRVLGVPIVNGKGQRVGNTATAWGTDDPTLQQRFVANAALIVTAVNDRDSLLAQVEELKADNARLREALRSLLDDKHTTYAVRCSSARAALNGGRAP